MNQDDLHFVEKCLPGKIQMRLISLVLFAGGVLGFIIGFQDDIPVAGRLLFFAMGVLGPLLGALMIWQSFAGGTHPLLDALERDPSRIHGLQVTEFGVYGRRSESANVSLKVGDTSVLVFCNRRAKRDRLLQILLERAPHLRQSEPGVPQRSG